MIRWIIWGVFTLIFLAGCASEGATAYQSNANPAPEDKTAENGAQLISLQQSQARPSSQEWGIVEFPNGARGAYGTYKPGEDIELRPIQDDFGAYVATAVLHIVGDPKGRGTENWIIGNRVLSPNDEGDMLRQTLGKTYMEGPTVHEIEVAPFKKNPEKYYTYKDDGALYWVPMLVKIRYSPPGESVLETATFRVMVRVDVDSYILVSGFFPQPES